MTENISVSLVNNSISLSPVTNSTNLYSASSNNVDFSSNVYSLSIVQQNNNVSISSPGPQGPMGSFSTTASVEYSEFAGSSTYSSFSGSSTFSSSSTYSSSSLFANFATTSTYSASSGMTDQVHILVKNTSASAMTKGQAVYVTGAQGSNINIGFAQANTEATSSKTLGLLEENIAINGFGHVATSGVVSGIDTSAANNEGDPVWLSPSVPGGLIYGLANKPYAPTGHLVYLGVVTRKNQNNGEIFVHVQNGFEVKELHDIYAQSPKNNDILQYNSVSSLWVAQSGSVSFASSAKYVIQIDGGGA